MSGSLRLIRRPLLARFLIKSANDSALEEANHEPHQLLWVIKEDIVAGILQLKELRTPILVVLVPLHNSVGAF